MEIERPRPQSSTQSQPVVERIVSQDEPPPPYEFFTRMPAAPGVVPTPMEAAPAVDVEMETEMKTMEESEAEPAVAAIATATTTVEPMEKKQRSIPRPPPDFKLWKNAREREKYDNLADLYAIIKTTEHLERAYVRDSITAEEYEPACSKLISQFRTIRHTLQDSVPDIRAFMAEYGLDCPAAGRRLIDVGVPATVEHGDVGQKAHEKEGAHRVAETVQYFITAMDSIKLNLIAVDQVHPLLADLVESLNHVPNLPQSYNGREKMLEWIRTLAGMRAHEELDEDQTRQLLFDLDNAYNGYHRALMNK